MNPIVPGWYGKLPALGDFGARRLPPHFCHGWDAWLATCLAAARQSLGDAYAERFLRAPVLFFLLTADVIDAGPWYGTMMPSMDRVGRHFPLTLAASAPLPCGAGAVAALLAWLEALRDAGLAMLTDDLGLGDFEQRLGAMPFPPPLALAPPAGAFAAWPMLGKDVAMAIADASLASLAGELRGCSFWWTLQPDGDNRLAAYRGMPPSNCFAQWLAPSALLQERP